MTDIKSIARIGLYTFLGAFFGALVLTGVPTSLADAKVLLVPALGAALAAEIVYLRKVFAKALADAAAGSLGPAPLAPTTTVTTATAVTSTPAAQPSPPAAP
jgi:hypothetical protein